MLSSIATRVVPAFGRLTVTTDAGTDFAPGSIIVANHTSLADPAIVLAALHRLGVRPVVLATAGLWRVPVLGRVLRREGHIPVHRGTVRAGEALDSAAAALGDGRLILIYGEGRLPPRRDSGEAAPGPFRSGVSRLVSATGAQVIPLGQAGARRVVSGSPSKQLAGLVTAPVRRPRVHVHVGARTPVSDDTAAANAYVRQAVTRAWETAVRQLGERAGRFR
ncbi:1-acyl-sn-glycerol-3-phosphate acyltransferase [Streptomyces sp. LX-29]|uniref:lysophospholipid acyltransferase family protein n=1 Tax=Streptomyces sp. LX-29 TaxID=2900152 RepID=UPI00240CF253|nr:lysophospholipid acyltransferase family protein [Streptomyces sp. LX-29]WFB10869.1 1-acyl-sn-glycerol-3-phosphate acyltransferase [Streptomyces sp. LX-29]